MSTHNLEDLPSSSAYSRDSQMHGYSSSQASRATSRASSTGIGQQRLQSSLHRRGTVTPRSRHTPYPTLNSPGSSASHTQRVSLRPVTVQGPTPRDLQPQDLPDPGIEFDALNEVVLAIDMKPNGDLGCAYYVAVDEVLFLLEDVAMAGTDLVDTLLLHSHPTTILLSARAPECLVQVLERNAGESDTGTGDFRGAYILRNLNSADFHPESAREKLSKLDLEQLNRQTMQYTTVVDDDEEDTVDDGGNGSRQSQMLRLAASINTESRLTMGCAGAVLSDLQRRRSTQHLPDDPDSLCAFHIRKIEMFSLFNSMFINADTIVALQIMQAELHPNSHQRGPGGSSSGTKESLSIYGLFHRHARTKQGRSKLRQIFLRPSLDIDLIRDRQQTIAFLSQPTNTEDIRTLSRLLGKIANMKPCVAMLKKGVDNQGRKVSVNNNIWATLQRFAAYTLQIRDLLRALPEGNVLSIVNKVIGTIDPHQIHRVGEIITKTIDFEQSEERGRTAVRSGVDSDLDELKRSYDGMEPFLTAVLASLRQQLPEWARGYIQNCSFLPQLGFLTVVTLETTTGKGCYDGEGLDDRWECMFAAEGCVYYKNRQMREMDAQFGDAYCMIIDREIEIVHSLGVSVLEHEDVILAVSEVLGELDSLLALAMGCCEHDWARPKMTTENIIEISAGRHPLQEFVVPSFIANDCHLAGGTGHRAPRSESQDREGRVPVGLEEEECGRHPSTLVLTGPNHSGKSVYLKQVALIVYLAHIGCYVPAEDAKIGITDRILTRVATRESVGRSESAFSIDLRQVAFAINFATPRSLVLVDEFGKGTNSTDGAGLMTALLDHFTSLGPDRPKVLAATHFHEIFEGGFLEACPNLALAYMDIHLDLDAEATEDQVTYLFKLVSGRSASSFGSRCAAVNGISEAVVARAEDLVLLQAHNEDLELACSALSEQESRKLEHAEMIARRFLEQDYSRAPQAGRATRKPGHYRNMLKQIFEEE